MVLNMNILIVKIDQICALKCTSLKSWPLSWDAETRECFGSINGTGSATRTHIRAHCAHFDIDLQTWG
jgi:hypothetical protein